MRDIINIARCGWGIEVAAVQQTSILFDASSVANIQFSIKRAEKQVAINSIHHSQLLTKPSIYLIYSMNKPPAK